MTSKIVITDKSQLSSDGTVTLSFKVLIDDEEKAVLQVIDRPETVLKSAEDCAKNFVALFESYSTEGVVPDVGEVIILNI
jgi:hypothetical protein